MTDKTPKSVEETINTIIKDSAKAVGGPEAIWKSAKALLKDALTAERARAEAAEKELADVERERDDALKREAVLESWATPEHVDELERELDAARATLKEVLDDALAELSHAMATPAEGYEPRPSMLRGDIARLVVEAKNARAEAARERESYSASEVARASLMVLRDQAVRERDAARAGAAKMREALENPCPCLECSDSPYYDTGPCTTKAALASDAGKSVLEELERLRKIEADTEAYAAELVSVGTDLANVARKAEREADKKRIAELETKYRLALKAIEPGAMERIANALGSPEAKEIEFWHKRADAAEAKMKALSEALDGVNLVNPEFEDARCSYVTVQIDRSSWEELKALAVAKEAE